jgi:hypothetical protein
MTTRSGRVVTACAAATTDAMLTATTGPAATALSAGAGAGHFGTRRYGWPVGTSGGVADRWAGQKAEASLKAVGDRRRSLRPRRQAAHRPGRPAHWVCAEDPLLGAGHAGRRAEGARIMQPGWSPPPPGGPLRLGTGPRASGVMGGRGWPPRPPATTCSSAATFAIAPAWPAFSVVCLLAGPARSPP